MRRSTGAVIDPGGQAGDRRAGRGRSVGQLIPALVELFDPGRFPFDRLVRFYAMDQIEVAPKDSRSGAALKPILRMPG